MAASQSRRSGTFASILFTLATLYATPALSAPLDAIYACAETEDAAERLACYDAAVGTLQQAEARGEVTTISRSEVEAVERDAFGFNLPTLPRLKGLFGGSKKKSKSTTPSKKDALTAPVATAESTIETPSADDRPKAAAPKTVAKPLMEIEAIDEIVLGLRSTKEFGGSKKVRFYLDNGQVWDQQGTRRVRIPKERDGRTNTVEIRRAAMGSYLLRVNGEGAAIRVRRVR